MRSRSWMSVKFLAWVACVLAVPACGQNTKNAAPNLIFASPSSGAAGVPLAPIIFLRFDSPLDQATVNPTNFRIDSGAGPLTGHSVFYNPTLYEVEIVPGSALAVTTAYQTTIFPQVAGTNGTPLAGGIAIPWTTSASTDSDRPSFAGASSVDTPTQTSLTLHWTNATDATPTGISYDIFMSNSSQTEDLSQYFQTTTTTAGSYVVSGLVKATTYFFIVRARDSGGNPDTNTQEVSATTSP